MITIVTGPPCGGKTTYVRENAKKGDVVIDMDRIALALTTEDIEEYQYSDSVRSVAMAARKAAVRQAIILSQGQREQTWIIHTDPTTSDRYNYKVAGARFVECSPGLKVCLERAKQRPSINQKKIDKGIRDYYAIR
jgi:tRNA uridine 5-carbamoylmethylation protein Kti12